MTDDNFFQTASKAYIRFVLDELKLSPSGLAKRAEIASTTLTRALNDPSHKFTLSMKTLGKIVSASGISPQPFFESTDFVDMSMVPYASPALYDESWGTNVNATARELEKNDASSTIVIGETAAGVWKAPELARLEDAGMLFLAVPNHRKVDTFALKVGDDTGEPYVHEQEYVICVRRQADRWSLGHGDLVVVERRRDGHSLIELTIRRLIEVPDGTPYLRFDNPSAKIREMIQLDHQFSDTPEMKILGQVSYVVRHVHDDSFTDEARRYGFKRTKLRD